MSATYREDYGSSADKPLEIIIHIEETKTVRPFYASWFDVLHKWVKCNALQ